MMMRPNLVMTALDTDKDGTISAGEIAAAPNSLKTLDKNGDGILAAAEVRPDAQANQTLDTLFAFDGNRDNKLSKDEVPERMQGIFARADTDKDGALTREEIIKASPPAPADPLFRALDANGNGSLSEAEISGAVAALKTLDKNEDGVLTGDEIRPPMPMRDGGRMFEENDANKDGKLSKEELPERMREMFDRLDADKDGFISKEEMGRMGGRRRE